MLGINSGSSTRLNRKKVWSFWLKLTSIRESNELRCSFSFGELVKFENRLELVGSGYKFSNLMALGSNRPAGSLFKLQPASVKVAVLAAHVPNGSRTKPVLVATRPERGSTTPLVTALVVAGSRIVPSGSDLPKTSFLALPD